MAVAACPELQSLRIGFWDEDEDDCEFQGMDHELFMSFVLQSDVTSRITDVRVCSDRHIESQTENSDANLKNLAWFLHPSLTSFSGTYQRIPAALRNSGHGVRVLDLYQCSIDIGAWEALLRGFPALEALTIFAEFRLATEPFDTDGASMCHALSRYTTKLRKSTLREAVEPDVYDTEEETQFVFDWDPMFSSTAERVGITDLSALTMLKELSLPVAMLLGPGSAAELNTSRLLHILPTSLERLTIDQDYPRESIDRYQLLQEALLSMLADTSSFTNLYHLEIYENELHHQKNPQGEHWCASIDGIGWNCERTLPNVHMSYHRQWFLGQAAEHLKTQKPLLLSRSRPKM